VVAAGPLCQDGDVSFFTAVMASDGSSWRARDVDVEDCSDLDDLADLMRGVALADDPVLCLIEREDGWFALVRVDGEDDPRLFVSDYAAAMAGHYEPVLTSAGDVDAEVPAGTHAYERPAAAPAAEVEPTDDEAEHDAQAEAEMAEALGGATFVQPDPDPEPVDLWAGDPGLLTDLGVSAVRLVELVDEHQDDPAAVLAALGEACGFDDLVEALR
jgi:putative tRNA adenosine deaminase-associated protein